MRPLTITQLRKIESKNRIISYYQELATYNRELHKEITKVSKSKYIVERYNQKIEINNLKRQLVDKTAECLRTEQVLNKIKLLSWGEGKVSDGGY